jgi:hypothetical protein
MQNRKTRLIYSAIKTPDGTVLESRHRHDYVTHKDTYSGEEYMLDGGLDYQRTTINHLPAIDLSVYEDDAHELVREHLRWGTYGKNGDQQLKRVKLSEMSNAHIKAVLKNCRGTTYPQIIAAMEEELHYRKINDIVISD